LEEVKVAMAASQDDQSALIASLQARIEALRDETVRYQQRPFSFAATPSPGPQPIEAGTAYRISQPAIQVLVDTLPRHGTKRYETRPLSDIKYLVIHHSAAPAEVGPRRIAEYHVNKQHWPGIGYHFLVGADGALYQGNTLETVSYHAAQANPYSVGICFLGDFTTTVPPAAQLQAGAHLAAWLMQQLGIPLDSVRGHREFMQTACPGEQWLRGQIWKQMLRQEIGSQFDRLPQQQAATLSGPALPAEAKVLYHYMLFWAHDGEWAERDWLHAQSYIGTFRPTVGFSAAEAAYAEYVTIVGGLLGVSQEVEDSLRAAGCRVDRIAGEDEAETKRILDALVEQGKRFLAFEA
jgi:N-acetyl-anhydromuramyl-L-alanine amidase AmpD